MNNHYTKLTDTDSIPLPTKDETIVLWGQAKTGKTAVLTALVSDPFQSSYKPSSGMDKKVIELGPIRYKFLDLSGQDRLFRLSLSQTKGAHQILLTFDLHNRESFEELTYYLECIRKTNPKAKITLIGTHLDINSPDTISAQEVEIFVKKHKITAHFEISSHYNTGIAPLRQHIQNLACPEKSVAEQHIDRLKKIASKEPNRKIKQALQNITTCLEAGLFTPNPELFFTEHLPLLDSDLKVLQHSRSSLFSTTLNVIALAFAYVSIIGVPALWLAGKLEANRKATGSPYLFDKRGQKQQAQEIIHLAVSELLGKKQ